MNIKKENRQFPSESEGRIFVTIFSDSEFFWQLTSKILLNSII